MKELKVEGKTVTIAVENGLTELGLRRDQVEVEVLSEGSAGFLGIGAKLAEVRLREKIWSEGSAEDKPQAKPSPQPERQAKSGSAVRREPARPAPRRNDKPRPKAKPRPTRKSEEPQIDSAKACAVTAEVLGEILKLAQLAKPSVRCAWDEKQSRVMAEVVSDDSPLLVGKGGRTIEALQFLVTVIVGRKTGVPTAIQVETEGYWKKIEDKILDEARSAVEKVKQTGSSYRFDPLEASMRRLIHRTLADHPDVVTASEGEGVWRKVVIKPRRGG
ncbi:MAG: Jag N-terminal domain-containing protein [Elusimicrobiota bacterium]